MSVTVVFRRPVATMFVSRNARSWRSTTEPETAASVARSGCVSGQLISLLADQHLPGAQVRALGAYLQEAPSACVGQAVEKAALRPFRGSAWHRSSAIGHVPEV